jgi:signal transduction histidine kinase
VAHELRTPLTALRTVGEVGLREAEGEEALRHVVSSMLEEGDKLEDVLEALLVLARGDSAHPRLTLEDLETRALLAEARERLEVLAAERGQLVVLEDGDAVTVRADHDLTLLALTNLLHNAIRYSHLGGKIVLRSVRRDGWATLEVVDRGPGVDPALHEKVFERFFRVDVARTREPGGSGLGLAIAKLFVEQQGGRVELDSEPGRGSTFRILLPTVG